MRLRYHILLACVLFSILLLSGARLLSVRRAMQRDRATRDLVKAVLHNDTPAALMALRKGADANVTNAPSPAPLTFWQAVRKLLNPSRPPQTTPGADDPGTPVLVMAAMSQNEAIVNSLLKQGANMNVHDEMGRTPLMGASESDPAPVLPVLLAHGARVNAADNDGNRALWYAVEYGSASEVALLLQAGAEVNARDKQGHTALFYADVCDKFLIGDRSSEDRKSAASAAATLRLLKQVGGHL